MAVSDDSVKNRVTDRPRLVRCSLIDSVGSSKLRGIARRAL